ncbi:HdeD family acid-resistance protein [Ruania zhangjianzhongii]|uniref:HdeD family acid-resistance protein n=1 Tax=Ruania zhangjianzhongii TaxID=2603206 RepID=UPI0011CC3188|nr:HdeD family acid-resistance protein [Ruania zhangjianzhongii]
MRAASPSTVRGRFGRELWYYSLIRGIIAVAFGILVLVSPMATVVVGVVWLGVFWIVDGVIAVIDGVRRRGSTGAGWEIAFGVIGMLAGLFLVIQPLQAASTLVLIAAIWAIIGGLTIALGALRGRGQPGWGWGVAVGVITLLFGLVMVFQPGLALATFVLLVGWYAIVLGLSMVVLALRIRVEGKQAAKDAARRA